MNKENIFDFFASIFSMYCVNASCHDSNTLHIFEGADPYISGLVAKKLATINHSLQH